MYRIPVHAGSSNIETFQVVAPNGDPYRLDAVTRITVELCSERAALSEGLQSLASDDGLTSITYAGSTISVRFGLLVPYPGEYYPIVKAFDPDNPDGVVIAGQGFTTEILLKVDC